MEPLLEINHINYAYHSMQGETPALQNIHFTVCKGDFIAVVGPSGCGKTTLLSLIAGLLLPEEGEILLNGKRLQEQSNNPIGYMLQKDHLLEWRTIYENTLLGLEINHQMTPTRIKAVNQMFRDYDLEHFKAARPSQLSGGMRQRAALIRTLALNPGLLLLDEPFSALDYQTRLNVSEDIYTILRKKHKSAILVTHDISEAISFCDRVVVLTNRPATVKEVVPIHLSIEEKTPLKARSAKEFQDYFNRLWGDLNE